MAMRNYRVVLRSGASFDVLAQMVVDEPSVSDDVRFFHDEAGHQLAATVKREEIAGLIMGPQKSSAFTQRL